MLPLYGALFGTVCRVRGNLYTAISFYYVETHEEMQR